MSEKVMIRDGETLSFDEYFHGVTLDESSKRLKEKEHALVDLGYENIMMDVECDWENTHIRMVYDRPETPAELKKRMKDLEKKTEAARKKLEKDRVLYEKLKRQFEDKK